MFTFRDSHACFVLFIFDPFKVIRTIEGISWIKLIRRKIYEASDTTTCTSGKDLISRLAEIRGFSSLRHFRFSLALLLESYSTLSRIVSVEEGDGPYHALATKNGEHD